MVNRNLLRDLVSDQDLSDAMQAAFSREDDAECDMDNWLREEKQNFESNKLVNGRVANIVGDKVIVDPFTITVVKVIGRRVGKVRVTWDAGATKPDAD